MARRNIDDSQSKIENVSEIKFKLSMIEQFLVTLVVILILKIVISIISNV